MKRLTAVVAVVMLFAAGPLLGPARAASAPSATTGPALSVTTTSANLTGSVNPNGQSTTYSFQFGTTTGYGSQTNPQPAGSGTEDQVVSATLTGLRPGTTYHYRVIATNASGTTVGADLVFKTLGVPPPPPPSPAPTATTGLAGNVGSHSATLHGTVNPKGARTTYYFEYGLTQFYGVRSTPKSLRAGNSSRSVSATLTGLQAGQTYHYRLVARNANGTSLGADRTFTLSTPSRSRALPAVTARTRPARDRRRPFRFKVRGKVIPPAGVSRSRACRGRVTIRFKAGRKTIRFRRARVTSRCSYRSRATLRLQRRSHPIRIRVVVRFRGNAVLKPRSAPTRSVRAG